MKPKILLMLLLKEKIKLNYSIPYQFLRYILMKFQGRDVEHDEPRRVGVDHLGRLLRGGEFDGRGVAS